MAGEVTKGSGLQRARRARKLIIRHRTHNAFGSATLHAENEMAPNGAGFGVTWLPPSHEHSVGFSAW